MSELTWNPVDFLQVIDVVPKEDEYGTAWHYDLERHGIRLQLSVYPLDRDVSIDIFCRQQEAPVVSLRLVDVPAARVIDDKRGQYIEFAGAKAFAGRFDEVSAPAYGFRLWVRPIMQIEPFAYPI